MSSVLDRETRIHRSSDLKKREGGEVYTFPAGTYSTRSLGRCNADPPPLDLKKREGGEVYTFPAGQYHPCAPQHSCTDGPTPLSADLD